MAINIDHLDLTFTSQQILTANEMNQISDKIDEIIDNLGETEVDPDFDDASARPLENQVITKTFKTKAHTIRYDSATSYVYLFDCDETYEAWAAAGSDPESALILSKTAITKPISRQFTITAVGSQSYNVTQAQGNAQVGATFISQEKQDGDTVWTTVSEAAYFTVQTLVDGVYTTRISRQYVADGGTFSANVFSFLSPGVNTVEIFAEGARSGQKSNYITYNITYSSLALSAPNFKWYVPFSYSTSTKISVPLYVEGNTNKVLEVELYDSNGVKVDSVQYNYNTTSQNVVAELDHPNKDGRYTVKAWLHTPDGSLSTEDVALVYDIACVANGTKKIVTINNVAEQGSVYNYAETKFFDYAVSDGNNGTSSVNFKFYLNDGTVISTVKQGNVTCGQLQDLTTSLEIDNTASFIDVNVVAVDPNSGAVLSEVYTWTIDNTASYGTVAPPVVYINPRSRSNQDDNPLMLINDVDGKQITGAIFTNFNKSTDLWTKDEEGNSVLRLLAHTHLSTNIRPFADAGNYLIPGVKGGTRGSTGLTIELDFATHYQLKSDAVLINISSELSVASGWQGLRVMPEEAVIHSLEAHTYDDAQNIQYREDVRHRVTIVVYPGYVGGTNFNLTQMYIDGRKNRAMNWISESEWSHNSVLNIGSDYGDIDVYGIRIYPTALNANGVHKNYINWLSTLSEKAKETNANKVLDSLDTDVSYEACKKKFNVFVIDSTQYNTDSTGKTHIAHSGDDSKYTSDWEFYWVDNPLWNVTLKEVPIDGQGTTSKQDYYRWNLRGKCGSSTKWVYASGAETTIKKGQFGDPNKYAKGVTKLTAKKNVASSSQSHKMGSVNGITDLYRQMINENSNRISIYQYPFVGFVRNIDEQGNSTYEFIGLYTVGPDKGDAVTFNYDTKNNPNLLMVEGSDNGPLASLFRVPWNLLNGFFGYSEAEEALMYNGMNSWDYDQGMPDSQKEGSKVYELMKSQFRPTYNWIHSTSRLIKPWTGTLDSLNSSIGTTAVNTAYMYWTTSDYKLYYYEAAIGRYILDDDGSAESTSFRGNLSEQLVDKGYGLIRASLSSMSADQLNEAFKSARLVKFSKELETLGRISKDSSIFKNNWDEHTGSTDTRAKNTYLRSNSNDQVCVWLFDDTDTIFLSNNQGLNRKSYSIESHDDYVYGWDGAHEAGKSLASPVYNGVTSVFWSNVEDAFYDRSNIQCEGYVAMRKMFSAMATLGGNTLSGDASLAQVLNYYEKYYYNQSQRYFPANLYNADTKYTYEDVQYMKDTGGLTLGASLNPIQQALGDNFEPERNWIEKRIVYLMSKYMYGLFSVNTSDKMTFRASSGSYLFPIQYIYDMYHSITNGKSTVMGNRTKARTVDGAGLYTTSEMDQDIGLLGASYITEVGDWCGFNIQESLAFPMRRLENIKLGDADANKVKISIRGLSISSCIGLRSLDIRNVTTLSGTIDMSNCIHIEKVLAGGCNVSTINLPSGGPLSKIEYPATTQNVYLRNFPLLTDAGLDLSLCKNNISNVILESCGVNSMLNTLLDIYETQKDAGKIVLHGIRIMGINATVSNASGLTRLYNMLTDTSATLYGLATDGSRLGDNPILNGTIRVSSGKGYLEDIEYIENHTGLKVTGVTKKYIKFADPEVLRVLMLSVAEGGAGLGDGIGITYEEALTVGDGVF